MSEQLSAEKIDQELLDACARGEDIAVLASYLHSLEGITNFIPTFYVCFFFHHNT
jgi:hypothetical protein